MKTLNHSLKAWQQHAFAADFTQAFKAEISRLGTKDLPLQQGLTQSSIALDDALSATILNCAEEKDRLCIKTGLFYTGMISGCNCADDPSPADVNNEYCEVNIFVDKKTAEMTAELVQK